VYICDECIVALQRDIEEELYKNVDENRGFAHPKTKEINQS